MSLFSGCRSSAEYRPFQRRSLISVILLLILAAGCSPPGDPRKTIGVTLLTKQHFFYQNLQAALEKAADREGYRLIISSSERDLARQEEHIDNFIYQRVDAIVLCPVNSEGIAPAIERANAAGIPVFTADIRAGGGKVVSHVGSDNYQGGRQAGDFLAKALVGKGKVAVIERPIVESAATRVRGFEDAVQQFAGLQIVARRNGGGDREVAQQTTADLLGSFPDIQGIFAINDPTALGVLAALENRGRTDIVVVGFDGDPEALAVLAKGSPLKADVEQNPAEIGITMIDVIHRHLSGQQVPESTLVGVTLREAPPAVAGGQDARRSLP